MTNEKDTKAAKDLKEAMADCTLHRMLIEKSEGITKAEATAKAWREGPDGLGKRMGGNYVK